MPTQLLIVEKLSKSFGPVAALQDISFTAKAGDIIGFMGPNGAGKSTTLRFVSGFYKPDKGAVIVAGIDMAENPTKARAKVGYLPEASGVYPELTGKEYLTFVASLYGVDEVGAVQKVAKDTGCDQYLERLMSGLSKGMKQRIHLAAALIHDPDVLLLDEPTDGLDPNQKHDMRKLLKKISKKKVILISTHALEEAEAICNRAIVISQGQIVADETPKKLAARAKGDMAKAFRNLTEIK